MKRAYPIRHVDDILGIRRRFQVDRLVILFVHPPDRPWQEALARIGARRIPGSQYFLYRVSD